MAEFIKEDQSSTLIIFFPTEGEPANLFKELHVELDKTIPSFTGTAIIVDFRGYANFGPELARAAAICGRMATKAGQRLYFAGLAIGGVKFLKSSGLDDLVIIAKDRSEAKRAEDARGNKVNIDVSFVNPFIAGALETFKIQCNFEATPGAPSLRKKGETGFLPDIIALIGLTSKAFNGTVALCFPASVFLAIMSGMLGEDLKELNQEIEDGAGELLNIIFGQAKIKLNEAGHQVEKAIPSVIRGHQLNLKHLSDNFLLVLPFTSPAGSFEIQIATDRKSLK